MTAEQQTVDVTLDQEHKHAGITHAKGATIPVPEHDAAWLEANGIGKPAKAQAPAREPDSSEVANLGRKR